MAQKKRSTLTDDKKSGAMKRIIGRRCTHSMKVNTRKFLKKVKKIFRKYRSPIFVPKNSKFFSSKTRFQPLLLKALVIQFCTLKKKLIFIAKSFIKIVFGSPSHSKENKKLKKY
jgi:hypothetical protein